MTPAPLQAGQAPSELALNRAGFTPLAFANALRIGSSSPVYVAGLLRREPRIAAWSTDTTPFRPDTEPWISELFPDPASPVTTTSTPSGMSTSTSCKLWTLAPRTSSTPDRVRTDGFNEARSSRCLPVSVSLARRPSTVPSNTTSPPSVPAPGPRSTTCSAIAIASGLCSTTSTVLPLSRSCSSRSFIRWMSWRSEEHTSELQSRSDLVCRLLLEKKKKKEIKLYILQKKKKKKKNNKEK